MAKQEETQEALAETEAPAVDQPETFSRDDIRSAVLDAPDEPEIVPFGKVKIEVRCPALEDLLQYRDMQDDDLAMARAIVNNCYVPGTDQRVFDMTDCQGLMKTKFSSDMRKLQKAVTKVLGGDEVINQAVDNQTKSHSE